MSVLAMQTQPQFTRLPSPGYSGMLARLFAELERAGVAYVVLHSYAHLPHEIDGNDLDLAVAERDFERVSQIIDRVARTAGGLIVQRIAHELFARYILVIDRDDPGDAVAFDFCSHYVKAGRLLLRDSVLLENRQRDPRGFFIPAPAAEFIYLLAKSLTKMPGAGKQLARLRQLAAHDPEGAQRNFARAFGTTDRFEQLLAGSPETWRVLTDRMRARSRSFPLRELGRRISRALRPAGLHIAVLGPDGSGKSTLLQNVENALAPCFSRRRVFRFRPDILNQIKPQLQPAPHERAPRSRAFSIAKVLFYFADWWIGSLVRLAPERRRGTLIIFDRDFNDLAVDQRRYLVQGVGQLIRILRPLAPRADATFILDGDSRAIHARKPELPVEELERQRQAFRQIAASGPRMHVISADQPADAVAKQVTAHVLQALAYRELRRSVPRTKRLFDIVVASFGIVILSPLLALLALVIRLKFGAPILFTQERPGLGGKPFLIRKFRTMPEVRDETGRMLPDVHRLTRFGKFLRSTSLDELPELVNVLRGEMSLVGPRPLLTRYLPLYSPEQARRHNVMPGITGWAQINGRNAASWPQKFVLDVWYVDHQSLVLDLKIIALTFAKVLKREGISQPGYVTADFFRGETSAVTPAEGKTI